MNSKCKEFVKYIVNGAPQHNKQVVEDDVCTHFHLTRDRKVYHNDYLAVRFSYSKSDSDTFSNTVLSLSALEKYDKIPFFCCTGSQVLHKFDTSCEYHIPKKDKS